MGGVWDIRSQEAFILSGTTKTRRSPYLACFFVFTSCYFWCRGEGDNGESDGRMIRNDWKETLVLSVGKGVLFNRGVYFWGF